MVSAPQEWRHWLEGAEHPFIVWSNPKNLTYLQSAKRLNSNSLTRNFTLTFRPGSWNVKPDVLSRQSSPDESEGIPDPILTPTWVVDTAEVLGSRV